jgi:hypothetical protein
MVSIARMRKKLAVLLFIVTATVVGTFIFIGLRHSTAGLKAELSMSNADIGIPGISKMYEARIVNRGLWPVRVQRCDFVDDAMTPGKMVAYAVERWDESAKRWTTVVDGSKGFCKPYPLGIVRAKLTTGLLWPGQSLATGEEATAARDGFNLGDRGRFVVFAGAAGDSSAALSTGEFVIDQRPTTDIPLRVRH